MATTEAQRSALFQKLCEETDKQVRAVHRGSVGIDFNLDALQGWFRNQWNRKTTALDVGSYLARGTVRVAAYFISFVPVIGTLLTMGIDEYVALARRKLDEGTVQYNGDHEVTGIFLAEHGMQAYVDALRKANQAEIDYTAMTSIGSCRDFTEKVARFYYWKYRLERLAYYHAVIEQYSRRVADVLATAATSSKNAEAHMKANAPKLFEDWTWHSAQCRGFCIFPYETLEISSPTNVSHDPRYAAGPDAMKPVRMIPTGKNPLPLPPRPPNLYKK